MFDVEKFICKIEQRPPLYDVQSKDYSNREIKARCWAEVCEAMYKDWNSIPIVTKHTRGKKLIKKWKAIRDNFVKDHKLVVLIKTGKSANKRKRYIYYDRLQFLLPHIKDNVNVSSNIKPITRNKSDVEKSNVTQDQIASDDLGQNQVANETVISTRISSTSSSTIVGDEFSCKKKFMNKQFRINKKAAIERSMALTAKKLTSILSENLVLQKEERQTDVYGHKAFLMSFVPILNSLPLHAAMQARLQISQIISELANIHSTENVFQKLDACPTYTNKQPNRILES